MKNEKGNSGQVKSETSKSGRPKGSVSLGIPTKSIKEAVDITKKVYTKFDDKELTFQDFMSSTGLPRGALMHTSAALKDFGLMEQTEYGWKVSTLGIGAAHGNLSSVKEAFEKNEIYKTLSKEFWDKDVSPSIIINFVRSHWKKGTNTKLIVDRFLEAKTYIKSLGVQGLKKDAVEIEQDRQGVDPERTEMLRLMYSIFPKYQQSDMKEQFDRLIEICKKNDISRLGDFLDGAKRFISTREDLDKIADDAIRFFEEDTGIVLYPEIQGRKKKQHEEITDTMETTEQR